MNEQQLIKYEERVICFFDILGFKQHIDETIKGDKHIKVILQSFDLIEKFGKDTTRKSNLLNSDLQVTQFSDSVVLSFKVDNKDQLAFSIMDLGRLIVELLQKGILVRGAITVGDVIHNETKLFGPAMNEVYKLESQIAVYPRVIITRDVLKFAQFSFEYENASRQAILKRVEIDLDGWHYVDYIFVLENFQIEDYFEYLEKICTMINNINIEDDYSIKAKYGWLNTKLNKALKNFEDSDLNSSEKNQLYVLQKNVKQNAGRLYSKTSII